MKKVIIGKELQEKMLESVNYLTDVVKTTLGPKGSNVIIDHSMFSPFVTNDGATIAKNIESEDAIINTILEITKEASLKTDEIVGDGTTTTLILLQSIFSESLKAIQSGYNPMLLKKTVENYLQKICKEFEKEKITPTRKHLLSIASIAAKDTNIGEVVCEAYQKVKSKNSIIIKEVNKNILKAYYYKGYQFEIQISNTFFLNNEKEIFLSSSEILIIHDFINDLEPISFILNDCIANKKNLIIIASDFDENIIREITTLNMDNTFCFLFKILEYGVHQRKLEHDIEMITNAKIVFDYSKISLENIGIINGITFNLNKATINFEVTKKIKEHLQSLEEEVKNLEDDFEKDFICKRLAMFKNGFAEIQIGAPTKTESHEKKMRILDALCAIESSKNGVLLGGGITFLKIANKIKGKEIIDIIFKRSFETVFNQILINAGINPSLLKEKIESSNYKLVYNISLDKLEKIENTNVFDSFSVVINSLINACSISTMLFTTTSLVINEYSNTLNKTNEYTEI